LAFSGSGCLVREPLSGAALARDVIAVICGA